MDILISVNTDVLKLIKELSLDSNSDIDKKIFINNINEILKGKKDEV